MCGPKSERWRDDLQKTEKQMMMVLVFGLIGLLVSAPPVGKSMSRARLRKNKGSAYCRATLARAGSTVRNHHRRHRLGLIAPPRRTGAMEPQWQPGS